MLSARMPNKAFAEQVAAALVGGDVVEPEEKLARALRSLFGDVQLLTSDEGFRVLRQKFVTELGLDMVPE